MLCLWPKIVKLKPAPLHNAVFMPLIPTMAVVIAALLHKLSAEIVLEICFFLQHTRHSVLFTPFSCSCSSLFLSLLPQLSLHFSLLPCLYGGTRKKQLSSSDEVIYEVIRCHEITRSSKGGDLGKGGAKGAQEKRAGCSDERL